MSEYGDEQRRRAVEWRGPLWWRARCWLADLLGGWACDLEPEDRTSASWAEGDRIVFVRTLRRPPDEPRPRDLDSRD